MVFLIVAPYFPSLSDNHILWLKEQNQTKEKTDEAAAGTVKNILLFNQVLLFSNCFSSYGKETVINTCISPRALGVFSQRSGAALRASKEV